VTSHKTVVYLDMLCCIISIGTLKLDFVSKICYQNKNTLTYQTSNNQHTTDKKRKILEKW